MSVKYPCFLCPSPLWQLKKQEALPTSASVIHSFIYLFIQQMFMEPYPARTSPGGNGPAVNKTAKTLACMSVKFLRHRHWALPRGAEPWTCTSFWAHRQVSPDTGTISDSWDFGIRDPSKFCSSQASYVKGEKIRGHFYLIPSLSFFPSFRI